MLRLTQGSIDPERDAPPRPTTRRSSAAPRNLVLVAVVAALLGRPLPGQQPHDHDLSDPSHGQVHFPTTCGPEAQPRLDAAVAMLHSFGYEDARRAFQTVASEHAGCGMAEWGVAMTYYHPLWAPPTREELQAGRAAAERAARVGAASERERSYIAAINAFYADADRDPHAARAAAYRDAMERTVQAFGDDDEARIFHALSILGAAPPSDPTRAEQRRAAAILTDLLPEHPRHPGIAHYTIHAFDYPDLAELALPAARVYAEIAPESAHAHHMPTHIFTRLGLWDESIASNLACRRAAEAQVARTHPGAVAFEAMHCHDYLAYAYLQLGQDDRAAQVLEAVSRARRFDDPTFFAVAYSILAVPARYALERRDWRGASALPMPDVELPWETFPEALGIRHFANAIGAARAGDVRRARVALDSLSALQAALAAGPPAGPYDWAGQLEANRLSAAGWLAFAEGRPDEAVRLLTAAARKEESVGKHPVTPGELLPAHELLGDLLLELGRPAEALAAYEASLSQTPRRFNGLLGAARAAHAAGARERAADHYRALLELAGDSTSRGAEIAEARAYVEPRAPWPHHR